MNIPRATPGDRLRTLVLLDPTADDGETALDLLRPVDVHVSLVVLLHGAQSEALHRYARCEGIGLATAGWNYLDQVAARIAAPYRLVETVIATGPDTAYELSSMASHGDVERILLPSSITAADGGLVDRLDPALAEIAVASPLRNAS